MGIYLCIFEKVLESIKFKNYQRQSFCFKYNFQGTINSSVNEKLPPILKIFYKVMHDKNSSLILKIIEKKIIQVIKNLLL